MKILIAHNRYREIGGEDAVFEAEAGLLEARGHQVIRHAESNRAIDNRIMVGVGVRAIWSQPSYASMALLLESHEPDLAHFHNIFPLISPSSYFACARRKVPVVQTLHNYRLLCPVATFFRDGRPCEDCLRKTAPWPGILHACYRGSRLQTASVAASVTVHRWLKTWQEKVDQYIVLTEFARAKFIEGGLDPQKLTVKPNFVHPDPGMRNGSGEYAVYLGRISPQKGIWTLLSAWSRVPRIPLRVIGEGPLLQQVRTHVEKSKLQNVEILGNLNHGAAMDALMGARFSVFPSESYEGFPMVILESLAAEVPVIASGHGAMAEIIKNERTGIHFVPGSHTDLADKVAWAWDHPDAMSKMGEHGRAEYLERYTADSNYLQLMDIYNRVLNR